MSQLIHQFERLASLSTKSYRQPDSEPKAL